MAQQNRDHPWKGIANYLYYDKKKTDQSEFRLANESSLLAQVPLSAGKEADSVEKYLPPFYENCIAPEGDSVKDI